MKFAYLIMAHNNPEQLHNLLYLLDYEGNDIFLHIDKKSKELNVDDYKNCLHKATVHVYKKYRVYHADITQTKCQMFLLREACKSYHDYYHLISNADLPLKSNAEIEAFFECNKGKQFVHFESDTWCHKENCIYYHFLFHLKCKTKGRIRDVLTSIDKLLIDMQREKGVCRKFFCGANWYSITQNLADDFIKSRRRVLKHVKYTISSDELVLQTFLKTMTDKEYTFYKRTDSPYDYVPVVREIDWHRGDPYIWKREDYSYLINSDCMFARKFDSKEDINVIRDISDYIEGK